MELFNKLKKILFDEVTEEIPVITKEDRREVKEPVKKVQEEPKRRFSEEKNDEVIIQKIETPKRDRKIELDDDLYDMPKLKEEAEKEVKRNTFTFPVFGDEEITPKRRERKEEKRVEKGKPSRREREASLREAEKPQKRDIGYTNAFDYSYGKYKGDYKTSREQSHEILTKTLEQKEERKAFTPSPIISPVYGVLNENYKKEDIVSKKENKKPMEPLDLDSVRRKAYGTLEDEIEVSLSKHLDVEKPQETKIPDYEENDDEGISIDDLLVDTSDYIEDEVEPKETKVEYESFEAEESEKELDEIIPVINDEEDKMDSYDEDEEIVPIVSQDEESDEVEEEIIEPIREGDYEEKSVVPISHLAEEDKKLKTEKTEENKEALGEEDLFDLIESIYEGKGEE